MAAIPRTTSAGPSPDHLANLPASKAASNDGTRWVDKPPMGSPTAVACPALKLRPPNDPKFYQAGNKRSGCFPVNTHGRPKLAAVASNRLRNGVSACGVHLFRGFYNAYDHIQVSGLNTQLNGEGHLPNPMVWLMTHTREPDDGMIMGALHGVLPLAHDERGGHRMLPRFVMRQSNSPLEHFSKFLGLGCFSVNVATSDNQRTGDKTSNASTLRVLNGQMARGDHPHIFVEAKIRGDGTVQVPDSSGAVVKCSRVVKPARGLFRRRLALDAPVPMMPVALTYEVLGRDKPVAMYSVGPTFTVTGQGERAGVARGLERLLARSNTLSMSGLLGAYLMHRLSTSPEVQLSPERIEALMARCVEGVRAAQDSRSARSINEVPVDVDLRDPARRAAMAKQAFAQLQGSLGLCDAQGWVRADNDRIGPVADLERPLPFGAQPFNWHRHKPLRYWGNRVRQQCQMMPELHAVLQAAFNEIA